MAATADLFSGVAELVKSRVPAADLDERDPDYIRESIPRLWLLASLYFRAEARGLGNVPEEGPVLLAGNHSGGNLTPDTGVFTLAFSTYFGVERVFHQLAHNLVLSMPGLSFLRKYGTVAASHDNARQAGVAVLVYRGGDYEVHRPSWEGRRVDFGGRKGFLRLALEEGVPIVPASRCCRSRSGSRGGSTSATCSATSRCRRRSPSRRSRPSTCSASSAPSPTSTRSTTTRAHDAGDPRRARRRAALPGLRMRVESRIEISAPPALVWEYVSDPSRYRMLLRVGSAEVGGLIEIVARNVYRGINPEASDATVTRLTKLLVPVVALGAVAFVFAGGQTIVTLLLLGYALVTQLFPALLISLVRPGWFTRDGVMAGIVAGVGVVAAMSFSGATPGSSTTVDSLVGGLPDFLAQLNLGVAALLVNLAVTGIVSVVTGATRTPARGPAVGHRAGVRG